jgi:hypothetical protein
MRKNYIFLLLFALVFLLQNTNAQSFWKNNTSPDKGLLGFNIGGALLFGGNGEIFNSATETPHGEYGILAGLDYFIKINRLYNINISVLSNYQQAHFHFDVNTETYDGYYRHFFINVPIAFEIPIPNYTYIHLRTGVSINSRNIWQPVNSNIAGFPYTTTINTQLFLYPEIFMGLSFLEEETSNFFIRAYVQYSADIFRSQVQQTELQYISNTFSHKGIYDSSRAQLIFSFYPKWKIKSTIKQSKDCPVF